MEPLQFKLPPEIAKKLEGKGIFGTPLPNDDPYARERYIADRANETPGDLTGYDCPSCLNRGYFHRVDSNGNRYSEACRCMNIRNSMRRLERSGLKDMVGRYTFASWKTIDPWQAKALAAAKAYAEEKRGWFLAAGTVGAGKTHLCTAICAQLLAEGIDTRYMLWREVATQAKAVVNDDYAYAKIVAPLKDVKVLYIDDLFKTGKRQLPTVGDVNLAFELLNARYNDSSKLTIISCEWTTDELIDIDEAVGSRIYERSKNYNLVFNGVKNWRLRDDA